MKKLIIIKYGELTTKKDNINFFLSQLKKNVSKILEGLDATITFDKSRMFAESFSKFPPTAYLFSLHRI